MNKGTLGIVFATILQIIALVFFLLGSFVGFGTIILGYDPNHGAYVATTYLSYPGAVRSIIITLFGAMVMSSVLIIRSELGKYTGPLFLGLLIVNIYRLLTIPPNWGAIGSAFSVDMLVQFELWSAVSFILLIIAQIVYARFVMLEAKSKGLLWIVSILAILTWIAVLALSVVFVFPLIIFRYFGLGLFSLLMTEGFLIFFPIVISIILILMNSVSKVRDLKKKNEGD
ncbi:MAG: hypothetical protein ACW98Y_11070 [Candidatus Thorarchaeota archaeon]|jgi:hypothetical protein